MEVWILNLIVSLFIPVFMIIYCNVYRVKAPKDMNGSNGYKTTMSRLSKDTWEFANHYYNRIMRIAGWILLMISIMVMFFTFGKDDNIIFNSILALFGIQIVVILICIIPTEKALRKNFDEYGNKRNCKK